MKTIPPTRPITRLTASFDPSMKTPDELVATADAALYRAKSKGRNQVEASPPPDPEAD